MTGSGHDVHFYRVLWVNYSNQANDYMEVNQQFQFQDTVLNTSWAPTPGMSSHTITRAIAKDPQPGGTYTFTTAETGVTDANGAPIAATCTERPQYRRRGN
jgi:hypothetical protein